MIALRYWRLIAEAFIVLALLLALSMEKRHSAKVEGQLSKANALIEVQNAGIAEAHSEGERMKAAYLKSLDAAKADNAKARSERVRLSRLPESQCQTSSDILEAYK